MVSTPKTLSKFKNKQQYIFAVHITKPPPNFQQSLHRHDFFELSFLEKGEGYFFSDFNRYKIHAGTLLFMRPGQIHYLEADLSQTVSTIIGVRPEFIALHGNQTNPLHTYAFFDIGAHPLLILNTEQQKAFESLTNLLVQRYKANSTNEALIYSYLQVILAEASQLYDQSHKRLLSVAANLTKRFKLLVETHFLERKKVQAYADDLHVTPNHLIKVIRDITGKTPGQVIKERLMLEAKRLLVYSDKDIASIAYELAFTDPSQFGAWFRNAEGKSPGQFRKDFRITMII